jgi:hypothetical protein
VEERQRRRVRGQCRESDEGIVDPDDERESREEVGWLRWS